MNTLSQVLKNEDYISKMLNELYNERKEMEKLCFENNFDEDYDWLCLDC